MDLVKSLSEQFPETSKSSIRKWIKHGRVSVKNGKAVLLPKQKDRGNLDIFYEDEHIVVVNKPEGLLTVATARIKDETLHAQVKKYFDRVWPVQRLDRGTSGVLVFALTEEAKEGLKQQFMKHTIYREYAGIVEGRLEGSGTWECRLKDDPSYTVRVNASGDLAITHYEAIKHSENHTFMKFILKTGKKNQIRVQSAHFGHPILGDRKYGSDKRAKGRLKLHAHKLGFLHPITKKKLFFISPNPFL